MPYSKQELSAKADSFVVSLARLSQKEREQMPSKHYGDDYNALRQLVLDAFPDKEGLLPPKVETYEAMGIGQTRARYVELHAYAVQIQNILRTV
jgi:hypothetical protein